MRLALPEIGIEAELNEEVVEVQLDDVSVPGKIAAHIACADFDAGNLASFAMRFNHHEGLPISGEKGLKECAQSKKKWVERDTGRERKAEAGS